MGKKQDATEERVKKRVSFSMENNKVEYISPVVVKVRDGLKNNRIGGEVVTSSMIDDYLSKKLKDHERWMRESLEQQRREWEQWTRRMEELMNQMSTNTNSNKNTSMIADKAAKVNMNVNTNVSLGLISTDAEEEEKEEEEEEE